MKILEFLAINRTWPTLEKMYYLYFHKFKKKIFKAPT